MTTATLVERPPLSFALGDETLSVRVRESQRAKTARIIVGPRRPLEVIVPRGVSDEEVDRFLASRRRWIEDKVATSRAIAARPAQLGLDGAVWLAGERVAVRVVERPTVGARLRDGVLELAGPG